MKVKNYRYLKGDVADMSLGVVVELRIRWTFTRALLKLAILLIIFFRGNKQKIKRAKKARDYVTICRLRIIFETHVVALYGVRFG